MALWDVISGKEQARGEELDRRLEQLNREKRARGEWTDDQFRQAEENRMAGATGSTRGDVLAAAGEGAVDGLAALPGQVRGALSDVAGWSLAFVPWWGWLVGAGVLFWWLGGLAWSRGILSRRGAQ